VDSACFLIKFSYRVEQQSYSDIKQLYGDRPFDPCHRAGVSVFLDNKVTLNAPVSEPSNSSADTGLGTDGAVQSMARVAVSLNKKA